MFCSLETYKTLPTSPLQPQQTSPVSIHRLSTLLLYLLDSLPNSILSIAMKSFFAVILALPLLAVASPLEVRTEGCGGGTFQCCQSTYNVSSHLPMAHSGFSSTFYRAGPRRARSFCKPTASQSTPMLTTASLVQAAMPAKAASATARLTAALQWYAIVIFFITDMCLLSPAQGLVSIGCVSIPISIGL